MSISSMQTTRRHTNRVRVPTRSGTSNAHRSKTSIACTGSNSPSYSSAMSIGRACANAACPTKTSRRTSTGRSRSRGYTGRFRSAKLAYAAAAGTALTQKKRVDHLGLILYQTHGQGIRFGQNFTTMNTLPQLYRGAAVTADHVYEEFDGFYPCQECGVEVAEADLVSGGCCSGRCFMRMVGL